MAIDYNFAAFILTHGRSGGVKTHDTLRSCGYTGKIFFIVDNEDQQLKAYIAKYGDKVIVFDKAHAAEITDAGDNFKKRNSVVYARNKCFEIAKSLGLDYFLQLDDDYTTFRWAMNDEGRYITSDTSTKSLDRIINASLKFLIDSKFDCVAWAQGGDFIGGEGSGLCQRFYKGQLLRKVMNSFFCITDKPFQFVGRMNDDVNTYVTGGQKGLLFCTIAQVRLEQHQTQANSGGLTEMYLEAGTYVKSFYTVMMAPSCTKISSVGAVNRRIHHKIDWKRCAPVILSEDHKKARYV
jgi:hypothetical protein